MKARLLRTDIIKELQGAIPENLERYRTGEFMFLQEDASKYIELDLELDFERICQIQCEEDDLREVQNCEHMFRVFPDLTPYMARDERLWIYLTHTLLLDYSRKRWPIPIDDEKAQLHIKSHFFASGNRGIERDNAASRLWWIAHICSRADKFELKEALQYFLYRSDVRANIIERPSTSQNTLVFSAILEKLRESYYGDQKLYERDTFRNFMIELNVQGGVKLLDALNKQTIDQIVSSLC